MRRHRWRCPRDLDFSIASRPPPGEDRPLTVGSRNLSNIALLDRDGDVVTARRAIHDSDVALVELSARDVASPLGDDWSPRDQVAFPVFGAFDWRVGSQRRLVDANSVLFVTGGQAFSEAHPHQSIGHASVIVTPAAETLAELGVSSRSAAFAAVTRPMTDAARLAVHRLLHADLDALAREEKVLRLLAAATESPPRSTPAPRIVERAKQVLHDHGMEPLSLSRIASLVGVSPVHLTQSFSRSEGMPLYRYHLRLRLGRALLELPRRASLIGLALDLGFSSHSHFSASFRAAFGLTPSTYRAQCSGL